MYEFEPFPPIIRKEAIDKLSALRALYGVVKEKYGEPGKDSTILSNAENDVLKNIGVFIKSYTAFLDEISTNSDSRLRNFPTSQIDSYITELKDMNNDYERIKSIPHIVNHEPLKEQKELLKATAEMLKESLDLGNHHKHILGTELPDLRSLLERIEGQLSGDLPMPALPEIQNGLRYAFELLTRYKKIESDSLSASRFPRTALAASNEDTRPLSGFKPFSEKDLEDSLELLPTGALQVTESGRLLESKKFPILFSKHGEHIIIAIPKSLASHPTTAVYLRNGTEYINHDGRFSSVHEAVEWLNISHMLKSVYKVLPKIDPINTDYERIKSALSEQNAVKNALPLSMPKASRWKRFIASLPGVAAALFPSSIGKVPDVNTGVGIPPLEVSEKIDQIPKQVYETGKIIFPEYKLGTRPPDVDAQSSSPVRTSEALKEQRFETAELEKIKSRFTHHVGKRGPQTIGKVFEHYGLTNNPGSNKIADRPLRWLQQVSAHILQKRAVEIYKDKRLSNSEKWPDMELLFVAAFSDERFIRELLAKVESSDVLNRSKNEKMKIQILNTLQEIIDDVDQVKD